MTAWGHHAFGGESFRPSGYYNDVWQLCSTLAATEAGLEGDGPWRAPSPLSGPAWFAVFASAAAVAAFFLVKRYRSGPKERVV